MPTPSCCKKNMPASSSCLRKRNISLDDALDFFYHSLTYRLISEGVSDLHCMSDDYLAEELRIEYQNAKK